MLLQADAAEDTNMIHWAGPHFPNINHHFNSLSSSSPFIFFSPELSVCPASPCRFVRLSHPLLSLCIFQQVSHLRTFMLCGLPLKKPASTASTCLSCCCFFTLNHALLYYFHMYYDIMFDMFLSMIVFVFPLSFSYSVSLCPVSLSFSSFT